jgi:outer membrane protein insertion porin family
MNPTLRKKIITRLFTGLICLLSFGTTQAQNGTGFGQDSNSIDYTYPREYEIGAIRFEGLSTLDENSLIARTGLRQGDRITIPGDRITTAIRNLWKLQLFSNVEIYIERVVGNTAFLLVKTTELPRLSRFRIEGVRKGEEDDIREKIGLVRGTPYKDHVKQGIINDIKAYFGDKGYLGCEIEVFPSPDSLGSNSVKLLIDVNKGPKVKIDEIVFYGNNNIEDAKLRRKMSETKERFRIDPFRKDTSIQVDKFKPGYVSDGLANMSWGNLKKLIGDRVRLNVFSSSKFLEDNYDLDKNLVVRHYNTKGYRDARIISDSVYFVDDDKLRIDVYVDEGPQYYFRNITWRGNVKYSGRQQPDDAAGRLDSVLTIKKGDLYNAERLEQRVNFDPNGADVRSLYMDDGYLFFDVTPVEVRVAADSIDLEIRITEGPQAVIGNVRIFGNTRTNEHVVRRELRTRPGDKFSRTDLIRSQREIANLGFFDPEQIGVNPIPNPADGTVDLEYTVVERPSDQLELSAGWGGVGRGVVGSVGVSFNNFSVRNMFKGSEWTPLPQGDGQKLSFRINTNGRIFQSYNMSFTEPWLGGKKPNSLTYSMFRTLLSNGVARNDEINTRSSFATNGVTLAYGIRLKWPDDYFTFLTTASLQNYALQDWTQNDFFLNNGNLYNVSTRFTLGRNSSGPNPYFPQQGSNINLSLQLTPPYSLFSNQDYASLPAEDRFKLIEYHKWRFNAEWFTPLVGKMVLRASAKLGYIGFYNSDIGHSGFEQYQLGGDGLSNFNIEGFDIISLRGYDPIINTTTGNEANQPIFNKFTMEMRYPISLNPSSTVFALAFAEGGNLYNTFDDYDPFNLNRSVGIGVRAFLPMFGLLGIDYGIRFDEVPGSPITESQGVFDYILNNGAFNIILGFEPE